MRKYLAVVAILLSVTACGGDSTPTGPSQGTTPAAFTFTPESENPSSRSFVLFDLGEGTPGQIAIGIRANDFPSGFSLFRGTIVFDSTVLRLINYGEGDFLKQGGALATFSITGLGTSRATVRIDRPSSLSAATGTGVVVALRFVSNTATTGSSALQWDEPHAYTSSFSETLLRTYGGTITVR